MKTAKFKVLAIILSLSMIIPMFTLSSSAASLGVGTKDVYFSLFSKQKTFTFTPDKDGLYNIYSDEAKGFFGSFLNKFTISNPACTITSGGTKLASFDDAMFYDTRWTSDFCGYVDLKAGETYTINVFSPGFVILACCSINLDYLGAIEYVECIPPIRTAYKASDSEVSYDEEYMEYSIDLDLRTMKIDIYFVGGESVTLHGGDEFYTQLDGSYIPEVFELGETDVLLQAPSIDFESEYTVSLAA